ncbi:plasminogen-binding N-terminal domain-containing protein [Hydrogenimonas sp.]
MLRLLTLLIVSYSTLLLSAPVPKQVTTTLQEVTKGGGIVPEGGLPEGMSGIVIRTFDENHEAIVATAVVTKSDADRSEVALKPFTALFQPRLPTIKAQPRNGDRVVLGYLYDRLLPIVPNARSFEKAKKSLKGFTLAHPDLFAVELASERDALPHRNNFQKICTKLHLGLVMFMFKDRSDFIDCNSWKRVAQSDLGAAEGELVAPFYNRFGPIEAPFYDFSNYELTDFDGYYGKVEEE